MIMFRGRESPVMQRFMFSGQKWLQNSGQKIVFDLSSDIASDLIFETIKTDIILKKICIGLILEIRYRYQEKNEDTIHLNLFKAGISGFREQLATIYTSCNGPGIRSDILYST